MPRENGEEASLAIAIIIKVIFGPIKHMKLIRCWFPKVCNLFYYFSVVKREWDIVLSLRCHYNTVRILHCLLWGSCAWTWWRFKQSIKICGCSKDNLNLKWNSHILANAQRTPLNSILLSRRCSIHPKIVNWVGNWDLKQTGNCCTDLQNVAQGIVA